MSGTCHYHSHCQISKKFDKKNGSTVQTRYTEHYTRNTVCKSKIGNMATMQNVGVSFHYVHDINHAVSARNEVFVHKSKMKNKKTTE